RLARALSDERDALLAGDAGALLRATQDKLALLRELEQGIDPALAGRLSELAELNRANGALLARRRRELDWALRHVGRTAGLRGHDATGVTAQGPRMRALAVAGARRGFREHAAAET